MGILVENISKDLALAVFERDSFTCKKCGRKVPNVVLLVLYKKSPKCGGKNAISNMITWCHECAEAHDIIGMQNIKREQLEMFFHWKQIGNDYSDDELRMLIEYVNQKIGPWHRVNKTGEKKIRKEMRLNNITDIIDVIDEAFESSIEYENDKITKDSAEDFINNIPRYLAVKRKGPVEQKLLYIRGICRKRFQYYRHDIATDLLDQYVEALRNKGYNDEVILHNLNTFLQPKTAKFGSWSVWRNSMYGWIDEINDMQPVKESIKEGKNMGQRIPENYIESFTYQLCMSVYRRIELLLFLQKQFPKWSKVKQRKLLLDLYINVLNYVRAQKQLFVSKQCKDKDGVEALIENYSENVDSGDYYYLEDYDEEVKCKMGYGVRYIIYTETFYDTFKNMLYDLSYVDKDYDLYSAVKALEYAITFFYERVSELESNVK